MTDRTSGAARVAAFHDVTTAIAEYLEMVGYGGVALGDWLVREAPAGARGTHELVVRFTRGPHHQAGEPHDP